MALRCIHKQALSDKRGFNIDLNINTNITDKSMWGNFYRELAFLYLDLPLFLYEPHIYFLIMNVKISCILKPGSLKIRDELLQQFTLL